MIARWFKSRNWGDALNPVLIKYLSGEKPIRLSRPGLNLKNKIIEENIRLPLDIIINKNLKEPIYLVIGSIISWADKNTIVWGSGFISEEHRLNEKPKKICAVRGPLTRKRVLEHGFDCPKIYGDPSLLFPKFYKPNIKKKYELGIIPHYTDKRDISLKKFKANNNIKIINIEGGIKRVVDDILSCHKICSSSLHGIIASDAYDVPSTWIKLSDKIIGNEFKFRDYFLSVERYNEKPLLITEKTTLEDIFNNFHDYEINIDLEMLLDSCPFKR